jgi:hypothetical protein
MQQNSEKEQVLITQLRATFGAGKFHTTTVIYAAEESPQLKAALQHAIPGCRVKRPRCFGSDLRDKVIRRTLARLAKQHFTTDRHGRWQVKEKVI